MLLVGARKGTSEAHPPLLAQRLPFFTHKHTLFPCPNELLRPSLLPSSVALDKYFHF